MSELKPCPFCGKENTVAGSTERMILGWWYACEDCFENRKGGVHEDRWNTRPIEDELRKRIAELESAQRWTPVQDIKVGEIYLIDGYDEWDSDRGTEVLDGFTIAKYYGIEDSCRVFADFYGTFLRFDMESDDLRNVYRLPEGA